MFVQRWSIVSLIGLLAWIAPASGDEPVDPANLQYAQRGSTLRLRKVERPTLIERLARTVDPVELEPREVIQLDAFLTANSRPRRLYRDGFYADRIATRGTAYDDPESRTLTASANVNHDEWQRLRSHLLFNRALLAAQTPPDAAARR